MEIGNILMVFYILLMVPGIIFLVAGFMGAGIDIDAGLDFYTPDADASGGIGVLARLAIYFCLGFGAGGIIGGVNNPAASLACASACGLALAMISYFIARFVTRMIMNSETAPCIPEKGDRCVALTNIRPGRTGQVKIFHVKKGHMHELLYFAVSDDVIALDDACSVTSVDGDTVRVVLDFPASEAVNKNSESCL